MKRGAIWVLAVVPLIVGFVFAKQLAYKRPHLVARDVDASDLVISPDGKKIVAKRSSNGLSDIVNLKDNFMLALSGSDNVLRSVRLLLVL